MANLHDLARRMRLHAKAVGEGSQEVVRKVAKAAGTAVVYGTPIDTSRARMNWQSTVGSPATGVLLPYPSQPGSPQEGTRAALSSLEDATIQYAGQEGGIWITNNLDYIQALNNGSSAQAPADFVAQAVLAGVRSVSTVRLLAP